VRPPVHLTVTLNLPDPNTDSNTDFTRYGVTPKYSGFFRGHLGIEICENQLSVFFRNSANKQTNADENVISLAER